MSSQFAQSHFAHLISPNFSSHFALCRLAPYPFRPLPLSPFANSPNHLFAYLPFRPFANSPFANSPNAISPLYCFAPSPLRPMPFCPFIISSLYHFITLFQFHWVRWLQHMISWNWSPNSYLVPGKDSRNPCLFFPGRTRIVNSLNCDSDDLQTDRHAKMNFSISASWMYWIYFNVIFETAGFIKNTPTLG